MNPPEYWQPCLTISIRLFSCKTVLAQKVDPEELPVVLLSSIEGAFIEKKLTHSTGHTRNVS